MVLVRAKKVGYYDNLLRYPAGSGLPRAGQPFELKPGDKMGSWMEVVTAADQPPPVVDQEALPIPVLESMRIDRMPGKVGVPVAPLAPPPTVRDGAEIPAAPQIADSPAIAGAPEPKNPSKPKRGSGNRKVL